MSCRASWNICTRKVVRARALAPPRMRTHVRYLMIKQQPAPPPSYLESRLQLEVTYFEIMNEQARVYLRGRALMRACGCVCVCARR